MTVESVASMFSVSTASVRNWIKTGYLAKAGKSVVSKTSVESFKHNIAGTEKLVTRANKLHKDISEDAYQFSHFIQSVEDVHSLGKKYQQSLSDAYKNKEGVYYTPDEIAADFFKFLPKDKTGLKFCDPCCGSGNFIIAAIHAGFNPENVYGYDIDPVAVEITKRRMAQITGNTKSNANFECGDFLSLTLAQKITHNFDVIFTNPPWGRKIPSDLKKGFSKTLGFGTGQDTTSLFMFASMSLLNKNGYLGFLVQDAFFNVAAFEQARRRVLELQLVSLTDYGKPFEGLMTKAKGIVIKNTCGQENNFVNCYEDGICLQRAQSSFLRNPKSILNIRCSSEQDKIIRHLYSLPHMTLQNHAKWALGVVTGNNKKHISSQALQGYIPIYKGSDISKKSLKSASCYIESDFSLYQQVAPRDLYEAPEKLIYRFISSDLVFFYDNQQRYILNSANLLILDEKFPISMQQLANVLNSKIINWLFRTVFDTHKVLRSDLEELPIHTGYFQQYTEFNDASYLDYLGLEELSDGTFRIKK